jgi:hypothetical protein
MDGTTSTSDGVDDGVPPPPVAKVAIRRNSFGTKNNKPNDRHEHNIFRSPPQLTFESSTEAVLVSRTRATSSEVHGILRTSDVNAMPFFGSLTLGIADLDYYYYVISSFRKTALKKWIL